MLHIYNSYTRKKEKFEPINPPFVGLYVCGPTVYSEPHIGNVRTFCSFDMICRYLLHLGYKVRYVRNITDAGHLTNERGEGVNRMESQAKLESLEPMEIVQKYTVSFHRIMDEFNTLPPTIEPCATGHILEQIEMIETLLKNGFAYVINGSVYFDVKKYNDKNKYGILSGRNIDELIAGYRDLDGQEEKRNSIDFALWKKASPEHIMQWQSPWGKGFPGWHLECSAMSTKYLGETFDIHGGGMDLKFPHHECEIAQNMASTNNGGAKYWLHSNMLNFNGQKMSKSFGNSILPMEFVTGNHPLLDKGYSPSVVKFLFLQTHYSSELDINVKGLQDAEKGLKRLMDAYHIINKFSEEKSIATNKTLEEKLVKMLNEMDEYMNDDFSTARVIANMFEIVPVINSLNEKKIGAEEIGGETIAKIKLYFKNYIENIFGLKEEIHSSNNDKLSGVMKMILDERNHAKQNKDFATSDRIRNQLEELGFIVKDSKEGTDWS